MTIENRLLPGWVVPLLTCSYCGKTFLSSKMRGLRTADGKFIECCCNNLKCLHSFLSEEVHY